MNISLRIFVRISCASELSAIHYLWRRDELWTLSSDPLSESSRSDLLWLHENLSFFTIRNDFFVQVRTQDLPLVCLTSVPLEHDVTQSIISPWQKTLKSQRFFPIWNESSCDMGNLTTMTLVFNLHGWQIVCCWYDIYFFKEHSNLLM